VDTTYPALAGATIAVPGGGNLQEAIDAAQPGDEIVLDAGATYDGPIALPNKAGDGWIVIRTSGIAQLPAEGTRVDPSMAGAMAKITVGNGRAIDASPGAHHFRFVGLEITPQPGVFVHNLIALGYSESSEADTAHHIVFDRCFIHGDAGVGARRGIAMNSRHTAVIDSWLSDFKEPGADSQAIASWNGAGPFKIVNNHLEGAGENVLFGGADPAIPGLVAADIQVCRNHFYKPTSWRGQPWWVKNQFELKSARRVIVAGNVFENHWQDQQAGFAIVLTPRNQDGGAPWITIEDVTFAYNLITHTSGGMNILGEDDIHGSEQQKRILVRDNLFDDVDSSKWGGAGRLFQILTWDRPVASLKIEHNTCRLSGASFINATGTPVAQGFIFRNNVVQRGNLGMIGDGTGEGNDTLNVYFGGMVFQNNVVVGASAALYPGGNFFPATDGEVGFVDAASGDYRLAAGSAYVGAATDGTDMGADLMALAAAIGGVTP
jgi:hypothetical protein